MGPTHHFVRRHLPARAAALAAFLLTAGALAATPAGAAAAAAPSRSASPALASTGTTASTAAATTGGLTTKGNDLTTMVSATPKCGLPAVHLPGQALGTNKIVAETQIGTTMYAGGSFSSVQVSPCGSGSTPTTYTRSNLVAFDATSGAVSSFAPVLNGTVWSLLPSATGSLVYICGDFTTADGLARRGLVKYNLSTGVVDPNFNAQLDGSCSDIKFVNGHLVILGSFAHVGTADRAAMASISQTTGAADTFIDLKMNATTYNLKPTGYRMMPRPDGSHLVVAGRFSSVLGQTREQVFMLNFTGSTATLDPWYSSWFTNRCTTGGHAYVRGLAWAPDGSAFVLDATGGAHHNSFCDSIERFNFDPANTNQTPAWEQYTGGDTFHSVVWTTAAIFYAGHMRYINNPPIYPLVIQNPCDPRTAGFDYSGYEGYNCTGPTAIYRPGIGALNPATGAVLSWDPQRSREEGAKSLYVSTSPAGLWVGSDGPYGGCATPGGTNHDDCDGLTPTFVGGDMFLPAL